MPMDNGNCSQGIVKAIRNPELLKLIGTTSLLMITEMNMMLRKHINY